MYSLIIQLIFTCPSDLIEKRDIIFQQSEYAKALKELTKWHNEVDEGKYMETFKGEICELTDVKSGKRKLDNKK